MERKMRNGKGYTITDGYKYLYIQGNKIAEHRLIIENSLNRSIHKKIHNDIGKNTRFKKIYTFNKHIILELYLELKNIRMVADILKCSEITIRRILKSVLEVKKMRDFRNRKGWN